MECRRVWICGSLLSFRKSWEGSRIKDSVVWQVLEVAWSRIQAEQLGPAVFSVFQVFVRVFLCALVVPPELPGAPEGTSPRRRGRTRRSACLISLSPSQYVNLSICLPVCWCVTKAVQLATSTSQYATTNCLSDPGTCPPVVVPSPS